MGMWTFILVGSFAATGAALALGTAAALFQYYRHGTMPGQDEPVELSQGRLVALSTRIVVGSAVCIYGVMSLRGAGLL